MKLDNNVGRELVEDISDLLEAENLISTKVYMISTSNCMKRIFPIIAVLIIGNLLSYIYKEATQISLVISFSILILMSLLFAQIKARFVISINDI